MSGTILPGNVSDFERALDVALARIDEVIIPIDVLWDPWRCPVDVLPYLAWALSVDVWRTEWPEDIKRAVVANSLNVHKIKGTRPAVELALKDIGFFAEVKEWFELTPKAKKGTFQVRGDFSSGLSISQIEQLILAVSAAKNTRSHMHFVAGVSSLNELSTYTLPRANALVRCFYYQESVEASFIDVAIASAVYVRSKTRVIFI